MVTVTTNGVEFYANAQWSGAKERDTNFAGKLSREEIPSGSFHYSYISIGGRTVEVQEYNAAVNTTQITKY